MTDTINRPRRVQAIELLRIIAAYGIVAYHAQAPFHEWAYSGLIVFLILSPMLDLQFNLGRIRSTTALARSLLVPWVFWMVVYGVANLAQQKPFIEGGSVMNILYGSSGHLWFLPYMFVVLAVLNRVKSYALTIIFYSCIVIVTVLLATVASWRPISLGWALPFPQWMHATPAILIGIIFGLTGKVGPWGKAALLFPAAALIVASSALLPGIGIPYTVGILAVAAAATLGVRILPPNWSVQPLAACMMGVYLCHILVLKIVGLATGPGNYLTVTITFVLASLGVWLTRRSVPASKIILG